MLPFIVALQVHIDVTHFGSGCNTAQGNIYETKMFFIFAV